MFFVVIQTTSKTLGSVVSVPSPVLSVETSWREREKGGCVYCECVHSEAPGPFISFFIEVDVVREHKAWKQKGRTCGLMLWSERPFFACEFVLFVFPVCLSANCYIF